MGSSQAVIRSASSGTKSARSSSLVRVHTSAAMRPPAEVPDTMVGSRSASSSALTTPTW